ncbi:MAG: hypothetical protein IPM18_12520 [Phycisphaerales bacterium]|nr:hypothetical protein [Phycisphaerales bacterium]
MPPASASTSKPRVPKYRLHKASGQGYVVLNGQARYFGRADDPASERYHQVVAAWLAAGRQAAAAPEQLTIQELLARSWRHVASYYVHPDGRPTTQQSAIRLRHYYCAAA